MWDMSLTQQAERNRGHEEENDVPDQHERVMSRIWVMSYIWMTRLWHITKKRVVFVTNMNESRYAYESYLSYEWLDCDTTKKKIVFLANMNESRHAYESYLSYSWLVFGHVTNTHVMNTASWTK